MKFRAWDKIDGGWITYQVAICSDGRLVHCDGYDWEFLEQEIDIQESTGLEDKNGIQIYEGDIISVGSPENLFIVKKGVVSREVVAYDEVNDFAVDIPCFFFQSINDGKPYFWIRDNHLGGHDKEITEVVGNIFENEDILNREKN